MPTSENLRALPMTELSVLREQQRTAPNLNKSTTLKGRDDNRGIHVCNALQ